jgi:hypothetical protein
MGARRTGWLTVLVATAANGQSVRVVLDMDGTTPGIQSSIRVPAGTTQVPGVAVYIYDPSGSHRIRGIGYLGGLDRGIAVGHTPNSSNLGTLTSLTGHVGVPIVPDSIHYLTDLIEKGFDGPELQYLESNGTMSPIPSAPVAPVFTVDVHLSGAQSGPTGRRRVGAPIPMLPRRRRPRRFWSTTSMANPAAPKSSSGPPATPTATAAPRRRCSTPTTSSAS